MDPDDLAGPTPAPFGPRPAPATIPSDPQRLAWALRLRGTPAWDAAKATNAGWSADPSPSDLADALQAWPALRRAQALLADPAGIQAQPAAPTPSPAAASPEQAQLWLASYAPDAAPPSAAPSPLQPLAAKSTAAGAPPVYDSWSTAQGQLATENDSISSNGVTYHHGSLGGVPGVFVDDPRHPGRSSSVFTQIGRGAVNSAHGFAPEPGVGNAGGQYFDKVIRQDGGRTTILRVDAQGRPVAAFDVDNGEAHEAQSPVDFIGPGEIKLGLEAAGLAAFKLGLPLVKAGVPKLVAAAAGIVGKAATEGPVVFKAPLEATLEELSQLRAYVDGSNEALQLGKLSASRRVSTKNALEDSARRAAAAERNRAAASGTPYQGNVAHVPDTTWTNNPFPHKWMDMSPRLNASLGAQSRRYTLGYKPTQFAVEGD